MSKNIKKGHDTPVNTECLNMETPPEDLRTGSECEREQTGNLPLDEGSSDCGDVKFIPEGSSCSPKVTSPKQDKCKNQDYSGYHRFSVAEVFSNKSIDGKCTSPYSRGVLGPGGYNQAVKDREEALLQAVGQPVGLLRRQNNGTRCPCYNESRGQSRSRCEICFGSGFVPGYIYYVNQKDPLGRILIRIEPYTENLPLKGEGKYQEVDVNAWTTSAPILRQRDVIISYNPDGSEEWRWEVMNVTRNHLFQGVQGAQKISLKRINPLDTIYKLDIFKIPDLKDISIDVSDFAPEATLIEEGLGDEDDGVFANVVVEQKYGDAAFSHMYTEGYKIGYELNFKRIVEGKAPLYSPYLREDGTIDDGYGPIFYASNGKPIRFSTPQTIEDNIGINPLEVIQAEKRRLFMRGWIDSCRDAKSDAERYMREQGLLW